MLPQMSSDRILAYRVFQGEVQKLEDMKKRPPDNTNKDHLSGIEVIVMEYLRLRMKEMEEKGHGWKD